MKYEKLVRDRIPDIIRKNGDTPVTRVLGEAEFADAVAAKLVEEAQEYAKDRTPDELADVLELVRTAASLQGVSMEDVERLRAEKEEKRGGFAERIYLVEA